MADYISKQEAIDSVCKYCEYYYNENVIQNIKEIPSADVVNKTDLLGWLLAYHTKSFELKGRYLPHEVIAWLVNDLSKDLLEDCEQNGSIY